MASMPLAPGITTSSRIDVRLLARASRTASSRAPASPTTSMSCSASSSGAGPARTTAWSSTSRTRSHRSRAAPPRRASCPRPRVDSIVSVPSSSATPLAHPEQAEAVVAAVAGSKPRPSSSITAVTRPILAGQDDADARAPRVLDDVRQRLLHDPVERGLDLRRAGARRRAGLDVDVDARSPRRPCRARRSSAGDEPEVVERLGRSSTARRRTSCSVATTSSRSAATGRAQLLVALSTSSSACRPSRMDVSAWPVSSWSSRASRRRSSSCASTTRRSASRATRCERSTATAARAANVSASRRSSSVKRGSSPTRSWATMTPIARSRDEERHVEPGRGAPSAAPPLVDLRIVAASSRRARCVRARARGRLFEPRARARRRRARRHCSPSAAAIRSSLPAGSTIATSCAPISSRRRRAMRSSSGRQVELADERIADLVQRLELARPASSPTRRAGRSRSRRRPGRRAASRAPRRPG